MSEEFTVGSGNVFADLGLPNPEEALAKSEIVAEIARITTQKCLSDKNASKILGLTIGKFRDLVRGRFSSYSIEELQALRLLLNLNKSC